MATPQTYQSYAISLNAVETPKAVTGMNKLFAAAVVNNQFRQLLLNEPMIALRQGYLGDAFDLTIEEQALIVSIRAKSLPELAQQVNKALDR
ncbi:MAG: hypothetical protein JW963_20670 [Anaerolineales bacterium]|nr:hypothetical protein [Anaerolineales bacterium]